VALLGATGAALLVNAGMAATMAAVRWRNRILVNLVLDYCEMFSVTNQEAKVVRADAFEEEIDCIVQERKDKRRGEVVIERKSFDQFIYKFHEILGTY
jgi:hypothetical protein